MNERMPTAPPPEDFDGASHELTRAEILRELEDLIRSTRDMYPKAADAKIDYDKGRLPWGLIALVYSEAEQREIIGEEPRAQRFDRAA